MPPTKKRKRAAKEDDGSSEESVAKDHQMGDVSDEDEDEQEPWDPMQCQWTISDEDFPDVPAYSTIFLDGQKTLSEIFSTFPDVSSYVKHDDTLGQLKDLRQVLAGETKPKPMKIALMGNAGQGKSSLINSLLDIPDLADTGSNGNSCTNVVFEYTIAPAVQDDDYAAYITYHDDMKIEQLLTEQIDNYQRFEFHQDEEWDEEERREYEALRDTALDMLHQLFCDHDDFVTAESTEKWLESRKEDVIQDIVEPLLSRAKDIILKDGSSLLVANAGPLLRKQLKPFATASNSDDIKRRRAIWPLIEVIRVCIRGARVVEHIVLVDMPGKGDRNRFRNRLSQEYIKRCNGAWVMTDIKRAVDEEAVKRMLADCFESFSELDVMNIALVCTQSDHNIDEKTYTHLKSKGINVEHIKAMNKCIRRDTKKYKKLVDEVERLGQRAVKAKLTERDVLRVSIDSMETAKKGKLMELRNEDVIKKARNAYNALVAGGRPLQVFCVSNYEYSKLKFPNKAGCLQASETGIPGLRKFLLRLAAPPVEKHLKRRTEAAVPSFIETVDLWCHKQPVANAKEVLAKITGPQELIPGHVKRMFASRQSALAETLLNQINGSKEDLAKSAQAQHQHWKPRGGKHKNGQPGWNACIYGAWVRHYGSYESKTQAHLSWNEEFTKGLKAMQPTWHRFNESRLEIGVVALKEQKDLLDGIPLALKNTVLPGKAALLEMITRETAALQHVYEDENDRQVRQNAAVWADVTRESELAYIRAALEDAYDSAIQTTGAGSTKQKFILLDHELGLEGDKNVFAIVSRLSSKRMLQTMQSC